MTPRFYWSAISRLLAAVVWVAGIFLLNPTTHAQRIGGRADPQDVQIENLARAIQENHADTKEVRTVLGEIQRDVAMMKGVGIGFCGLMSLLQLLTVLEHRKNRGHTFKVQAVKGEDHGE